MAHDEPPHQDICCLQIQLFSSLVVNELIVFNRGCTFLALKMPPFIMSVKFHYVFINGVHCCMTSLLARMFSKQRSRYCHSPGVIGGCDVVGGVVRKL